MLTVTPNNVTGDGVVKATNGALTAVLLVDNGGGGGSVTLYDNNTASGTIVFEAEVTGNSSLFCPFFYPVAFSQLYADVTGATVTLYTI